MKEDEVKIYMSEIKKIAELFGGQVAVLNAKVTLLEERINKLEKV